MRIVLLFLMLCSTILPLSAQDDMKQLDMQVIRDFFNAVHASKVSAADIVEQFMFVEDKENIRGTAHFIDSHLRKRDEMGCPCIDCQNCMIIFDADHPFRIVSLLDHPGEDTLFQNKIPEVKKNIYLIILRGQIYQYVLMKDGKIASVFYIKKGSDDSADFLLF